MSYALVALAALLFGVVVLGFFMARWAAAKIEVQARQWRDECRDQRIDFATREAALVAAHEARERGNEERQRLLLDHIRLLTQPQAVTLPEPEPHTEQLSVSEADARAAAKWYEKEPSLPGEE